MLVKGHTCTVCGYIVLKEGEPGNEATCTCRALCLEYRVSWVRGSSFFLGKVTALDVLCCFALFVCLTLLASFFLPSHLKTCTCFFKQARSNKQTRQSNTAHPRQSCTCMYLYRGNTCIIRQLQSIKLYA